MYTAGRIVSYMHSDRMFIFTMRTSSGVSESVESRIFNRMNLELLSTLLNVLFFPIVLEGIDSN